MGDVGAFLSHTLSFTLRFVMMHPSFICVMIRSKNWRGAKLVKDTTKNFFGGIKKKLVERWNRCFEVEGDYVEK
jgi:hypothetical protein